VSNRYLRLAPVVRQLANEAGFQAIQVRNKEDNDDQIFAADWVLVTNNPAVLENAAIRLRAAPIERRDGKRVWTDSFNNVIEIIKWPDMTGRSRW
jgi:pyruvate/2-oxoglutarate dehydrogenase complex dihydrolipoamide acyltransferase (E2) component